MTQQVKLRDYKAAEREVQSADARRGFVAHVIVSILVSIALITINVVVAPQFPWSPFPVVGMSVGVAFHYAFGVRRIDREVDREQARIEQHAKRRSVA